MLLQFSALARGPFTDYTDVEHVLAFLTDALPPELKSSGTAARSKAWADWVAGHDRKIRERLVRGDEDTIINWLLFGTSFTSQPRPFIGALATPDVLRKWISQRSKDLIDEEASTGGVQRFIGVDEGIRDRDRKAGEKFWMG